MTRAPKERPIEQRIWLFVMDVADDAERVARRVYLYALGKASECTDWGEGADLSGGTGKGPF